MPILVVGDSMLDVYISGSVDRISPEAPVPVIRQGRVEDTPGGAANVAANIASLGGTAHLVTSAGDDQAGRTLASTLARRGITLDVIITKDKPTTVKTRFLADQHQLLRLDREDASPISPRAEQAVLAAVTRAIGRCRAVLVSDYDKGVLTDDVLAGIVAAARRCAIPVIVDPKRRDFSAYRGATFIKPNRTEVQAATGLPMTSDGEIERAASLLAARTAANILVTRSEAGMSLVRPDGTSVHMPTQARDVFDVAGAGDTVAAAFGLSLAGGSTDAQAMAYANLAAGIAVSKRRIVPVLSEELEAERSLFAGADLPAKGQLVDADKAMSLRQIWKRQGLVVGFTNGCFDLVHPGHIALLREAGKACDRLIVGLNSDASIRRLKGRNRPIQSELARAAVLGAMGQVDAVVIFDEDTPVRLIEGLQPDLLVKGGDYKIDEIVGADLVTRAGGRVMIVDLVPRQSTTRLVAAGNLSASLPDDRQSPLLPSSPRMLN